MHEPKKLSSYQEPFLDIIEKTFRDGSHTLTTSTPATAFSWQRRFYGYRQALERRSDLYGLFEASQWIVVSRKDSTLTFSLRLPKDHPITLDLREKLHRAVNPPPAAKPTPAAKPITEPEPTASRQPPDWLESFKPKGSKDDLFNK